MNTDELELYEELYSEQGTRKGKWVTKMKDDRYAPISNRQATQRRAEDVKNRWRKASPL